MSARLGPVLETLLADVVDALATACAPVGVSTIELGEVPFDWCCQGHAFIRAPRIHPTNPFPQQAFRNGNCELPTAVMVEVGVLRCAPTLQANGDSPDPEDVTAVSLQVYDDAAILYEVLTGFEIGGGARASTVIDSWEPYDTQGGCAGGRWLVWLDPLICAPTCTSEGDEG